jgi:hypothetical protein
MLGRSALLAASVGLACTAVAPAAVRPLPGVRTPSGNISCFVTPGPNATLHCSVRRAVYARLMQKVRCGPPIELDWVGFGLPARSKARVACSGGILYSPRTERPAYVVVRYGHIWHAGPFDCTSAVDGLGCSNHTGHGLFISRQTWRLW